MNGDAPHELVYITFSRHSLKTKCGLQKLPPSIGKWAVGQLEGKKGLEGEGRYQTGGFGAMEPVTYVTRRGGVFWSKDKSVRSLGAIEASSSPLLHPATLTRIGSVVDENKHADRRTNGWL